MDNLARQTLTESPSVPQVELFSHLAPRPRSLKDTGLSKDFVAELLLKHLYNGGVLDLRQLAERSALAGPVVETTLNFLRAEAYVEVRGSSGGVGLRYALTDRGRAGALDALMRSGYVGPAPVPLDEYERVSVAQSVHRCVITRNTMHEAFAEVVIRESLLDQLGPALQSGRAIFVYGPAGTGKTYTVQRLPRMLGDTILIPHAIAVGETVIQFFDPVVHQVATEAEAMPGLMLEQGYDPRFVCCRRPTVITGGELTLDMLELRYDSDTKLYQAPLQLKANNGVFMVDDLGRQRAATADLLNRWIVPMEEKRDFLNLRSGKHFPVPFDVILIFSTNMNPLELADEAFLRRLGFKIRFDHLTPGEYATIWQQVCEQKDIACDSEVLGFVLEALHARRKVPLLPCHPRDLLELAQDQCRYQGEPNRVTVDRVQWAWDNYFVRLDED